ncbi:MAG TPA: DMT family transporter [Burkholderiales bacterium]|nr:DMT family transporter [Burkholderiales bacterium]
MSTPSHSVALDHLPRRLWWVLAGLTLAWGFNWTAMKVALSDVPPWTFRSLCLGLGSGILFAVLRAGGHSLSVPRDQWGRLALLAFFNITCWNLLVAFGLLFIPSSRAAILAYLMPAWAIPLSIVVLGERFTGRRLAGLALGMVGLVLLLGEGVRSLGSAPVGSLLVVGASLSWALGTVLQKRFPMRMAPGPYTAWIMLLGGVPVFAGALIFDDLGTLGRAGLWPALAIAYNVLVAFAWAHWAWIKLATSVPVGVFSLSMLIVPVVGVISGMVFLGERPRWTEYAALALVLGSLVATALPGRRS